MGRSPPDKRAPFRSHDAVVGFDKNRCLSRTQNLNRFELNIRLRFISEADLVPTSAPELFFAGFSKSLELSFILKTRAHSKQYLKNTFYGKFAFPSA